LGPGLLTLGVRAPELKGRGPPSFDNQGPQTPGAQDPQALGPTVPKQWGPQKLQLIFCIEQKLALNLHACLYRLRASIHL